MAKVKTPRFGWALAWWGHFFKEGLRIAGALGEIDLFVSKAAGKGVRMYRQDFKLPKTTRVSRDTTASAAPVGLFYDAVYHIRLRHRAGARNRSAQRHGQGLSAGYRSAEHRAPQVVRQHDRR